MPDLVLWRISNHASLEGLGGLVASARWHSRGHRIVYLGQSASACLVESMVHLEMPENLLPALYQLLKVEVPDSVSRERVDIGDLPKDWIADATATRERGDHWLRNNGSALLEVPSAIVPETSNWVLNPDHADAKQIRILWSQQYPYDHRLFQKRTR